MFRKSVQQLAVPVLKQQRRTLAKKAAKGAEAPEVVLPIQLFGLEAKYANALFTAAMKNKALPQVEGDLKAVQSWLETESFQKYISNPVISRSDKAADMVKAGKGMSDLTQGLLVVLADNGRLKNLGGVLNAFDTLLRAQRKVVEAKVVSADALSGSQKSAVEKAIKSGYLSKDETLSLKLEVDPTIMGGLQVQIGDRFLNLSIASRIAEVERQFTN